MKFNWEFFLWDWLGYLARMMATILIIGVPMILLVWLAYQGIWGLASAAVLLLILVAAFMAYMDNR